MFFSGGWGRKKRPVPEKASSSTPTRETPKVFPDDAYRFEKPIQALWDAANTSSFEVMHFQFQLACSEALDASPRCRVSSASIAAVLSRPQSFGSDASRLSRRTKNFSSYTVRL